LHSNVYSLTVERGSFRVLGSSWLRIASLIQVRGVNPILFSFLFY